MYIYWRLVLVLLLSKNNKKFVPQRLFAIICYAKKMLFRF